MAKQSEFTGEQCMGERVKHRSVKYPQCTSDAVLHLQWITNESGLPDLGVTWESWACAHHTTQVIRWALAQKGLVGPVKVEGIDP